MDVRVGLERKLSAEELMFLNCGVGEDSWESLGLQGDQTSQSKRKLVLNIHWNDWGWSRNSNTLATLCEELMLFNCGARASSWESFRQQGDQTSQSNRKSTLNIHWKDWRWSWNSNTLATWCKYLTHLKDTDAGKDWRQEEKGMTEDEMIGWHHQLNPHEVEQALKVGDGQEL